MTSLSCTKLHFLLQNKYTKLLINVCFYLCIFICLLSFISLQLIYCISALFLRNQSSNLVSEEREDKDTTSKMSSPSRELSCDQQMKNLTTSLNDEAGTSEPR